MKWILDLVGGSWIKIIGGFIILALIGWGLWWIANTFSKGLEFDALESRYEAEVECLGTSLCDKRALQAAEAGAKAVADAINEANAQQKKADADRKIRDEANKAEADKKINEAHAKLLQLQSKLDQQIATDKDCAHGQLRKLFVVTDMNHPSRLLLIHALLASVMILPACTTTPHDTTIPTPVVIQQKVPVKWADSYFQACNTPPALTADSNNGDLLRTYYETLETISCLQTRLDSIRAENDKLK